MGNEKKLNLPSCVVIIVSGMIGSAIYSLSGVTIQMAGASAMLSWIIAGAIMLFYGLFMCELATIFPKSGGAFYFPYKALGKTEVEGKFFGYISALAYIVSCIMAIAFSATYVGTYLSASFAFAKDKQILFSVITIVFSYFYNTLDIKNANKISGALTVLLVATLFIFIFFSTTSQTFSPDITKNFFDTGEIKNIGFLASVPTAMVGYGSIVAMSFMANDVKDRKKNLPLAAFISMGIVVLLYAVSIFAVVGNISSKELTESGMTYIPFFAVSFLKLSHIPFLANVVSISAVIALVTTVVVMTSLTSRAIQAMASSGIFPKCLANENKRGVPAMASFVTCVIAGVLSIFPNLTQQVVSLGVLLNVIGVTFHLLSLVVARNKIKNNDERLKGAIKNDIYKAPGNNLFIIFILILLLACYMPDLINGGYKVWLFTIAIYVVGLVYYKLRVSKIGDGGEPSKSKVGDGGEPSSEGRSATFAEQPRSSCSR